MSFSLGIVGLPNVGKSTLFQALTKQKVDAANYPFCTIDPNVGVVPVPDDRLEKLAKLSESKKILPTTIEFYDIAGLVKGAAKGEGLGNKFLSHIREVKAIIHVVRQFENKDVIHVHGEVDPKSDADTVNLELVLADLEIAEKRYDKILSQLKGPQDKILEAEKNVFTKVLEALRSNKLLHSIDFTDDEEAILKSYNFLTLKPQLFVYNVSEEELKKPANLPDNAIRICAQLESELAELSDSEVKEYLTQLDVKETGLTQLIHKSYELLGLITYLTTGPEETRAWTVTKGATAPEGAGEIHSDFEKNFIRVEIINWQDLLDAGSWTKAKDLGKVRTEGKDYVLNDGDTVYFLTTS